MSTFNLNESIKCGKLNIKVASCHCKQDITLEQSQKPLTKDCLQCDGTGKEENLNGLPSICRKCGGVGFLTKTAKTDSSIQKFAQNDSPSEGDDIQEAGAPSADENFGYYGGEEHLPLAGDEINEKQLRSELGTIISSISQELKLSLFDEVCTILQLSPAEKLRIGSDANGQPNINSKIDFIPIALDRMNDQQLRTLDAKISKII
jgi:hypothetical protein